MSHGLGPEDVFDARSYRQRTWFRLIEKAEKTIALGSRCSRGGHRLRSRRGHCVQCDPKKLAYQARWNAEQYVYIAGSLGNSLIKIGTCSDCNQREKQLRAERYGGCSDWRLLLTRKVKRAAAIEYAAHKALSDYWVTPRAYVKDGNFQSATELLSCSFSRAKAVLNSVIAGQTISETWEASPDTQNAFE
jgi:hypothetical protein